MSPSQDDEIYGRVAGNFMIARLNIKGVFRRSVVWVSAFSKKEGARGIIINKSMDKRLGECTPAFTGTALDRIPMFLGGPLEENRLSVLACIRNYLTGGSEIQLGLPPDKIRDFAYNPAARLMAFAGYAAWSPGELENELARGGWLVAQVDFDLWLNTPSNALWEKLLERCKKLDAQFMLRAPRNLEEN